MFYCPMTTLNYAGHYILSAVQEFEVLLLRRRKNPTQADMTRVLSWPRAYTEQTIT